MGNVPKPLPPLGAAADTHLKGRANLLNLPPLRPPILIYTFTQKSLYRLSAKGFKIRLHLNKRQSNG